MQPDPGQEGWSKGCGLRFQEIDPRAELGGFQNHILVDRQVHPIIDVGPERGDASGFGRALEK